MDKVKNMLFSLMSQTLSMEAFETWLYSDEYVNAHLEDNDFILELLLVNLKSKQAMDDIKKICFENFTEEKCLIEIIKLNCEFLLKGDMHYELGDNIDRFFKNIMQFNKPSDDYILLSQISHFNDEWNLVVYGYYHEEDVKEEIIDFITTVRDSLSLSKQPEAIEILKKGIELKEQQYVYPEQKTKKWYQFWKS